MCMLASFPAYIIIEPGNEAMSLCVCWPGSLYYNRAWERGHVIVCMLASFPAYIIIEPGNEAMSLCVCWPRSQPIL